ncbi:MAG TPA: hypothetical protein PKN96_10725 [Flavobacterium sp.]|uniref:hypothetical protein n=1 Tax=Flavobacterium sp. TaxID=239 RepID=UPI002BEDE2DD|nr:hypothetical protein [Flavobacterium sp.]HNP33754.1 hypothetical protein [Flavobacterium sp.]
MENLRQLSDGQLMSLFQNNKLDKELKAHIIAEIDRRDLKKEVPEAKSLDLMSKLIIISTSIVGYRYNLNQTNKLIAEGRVKEYKQYWNYIIIGLAINIILFLLIAKYIIKPYAANQ